MATPPSPLTYDVSTLTVNEFYGYYPLLSLAIVALSLFTVAGLIVGTIVFIKKNARFMHTVMITGYLEAAGYASMVYSISMSGKADIYVSYVMTQVFTVLPPNLLQATNYYLLGKLIFLSGIGQGKRLLRPVSLTIIFASADLLALTVQAAGITLWATSKSSGNPNQNMIKIGNFITVGGLAFQLLAFIVFVFVVIWSHRHKQNTLRKEHGFKQVYALLYATIALVTLRNIYRFIEFLQQAILTWPFDPDTYVLSEQQALFFALDTLPILLAFACYILLHPAFFMDGMNHLSSIRLSSSVHIHGSEKDEKNMESGSAWPSIGA